MNRIFIHTTLRGMWNGKEYKGSDLFLKFRFEYADNSAVLQDDSPLAKVHVQEADITIFGMSDICHKCLFMDDELICFLRYTS